MPTWKVKEKTVDEKGLATTKTITTENISVMQKLLGMNEKKKDSNKPQQEQEPKKASKKKETTKELEPPKKTVAKKAPVKTMTNTSFVPKDETVIYSKGKWVITKKPIGGLYTYTLYEKDFCRAQLLFMPDDDHKAFKEFKDRIKE